LLLIEEFITDDDGSELNIFQCVTDLLRENVAMRKVFNLSSTVRINAINDLGEQQCRLSQDATAVGMEVELE